MSVLESYKNNEAMRKAYYRMNNLTHITAIRSQDDKAYEPFVCRIDLVGFREGRIFKTIKEVKAWAKEYAPGLEWIARKPYD